MSNYVKYTAADGTVHLCHEDSPMLMHAKKSDNNDRILSMALQTFKTTKNNLKSFCNENKIKLVPFVSTLNTYNMKIPVQDIKGTQHSISLAYMDLHFSFESSPSSDDLESELSKRLITNYLNEDTASINDAMREANKNLKKYHLMPGGYYIRNESYEAIKARSTKI